jgi:hypothetical protein
MSDDRKRWYRFDPDRAPSDAFMEYLEGYASAFDMYPVCSRAPVVSNYHLLLDDFWRQLAEDVADALLSIMGAVYIATLPASPTTAIIPTVLLVAGIGGPSVARVLADQIYLRNTQVPPRADRSNN